MCKNVLLVTEIDSSVKINVISEKVTPNLEYELGAADCALQLVKVKVQV